MPALLLFALACAPTVHVGDTGLTGAATGDHAVVVTVAMDYATGALTTVDVDDLAVDDTLMTTSGDPGVAADDGYVIQLDRFGYDTVRLLEPGAWSAPRWQRDVGDHANPLDATICADKLFVSLHSRDHLGVYRLEDGAELGAVDLSGFSDGDGVGPEPASIVERADGTLLVALQRFDQLHEWADMGGRVVEIDCATERVTRSWEVGANPSVHPWDDDRVLLTAEPFGADPGGLYALSPADGALTPLEAASALGGSPAGASVHDGTALIATLADDRSGYDLLCVDVDRGEVELLDHTTSFVTAVERAPDGAAWVALHWGWTDPNAAFAGLRLFDGCTERATVRTALGPYGLAFVTP